ncbi:MAG: tetratricopeptide repeat protein, partial [Mesorhizobium sp.]
GSSASRRSKRIRTPSSAISGWPGPYRNDAVFWHKQENSPDEALKHAAEYADKALQLAPDDANAHYAGARIHTEAGEVEQAIARYDQAIALNPSASNVLAGSASPLLVVGRIDEAIDRIKQAMGIDPFHPDGTTGTWAGRSGKRTIARPR